MKTLSLLITALLLAASTGLALAEETSSEKPEYISWTWDDVED